MEYCIPQEAGENSLKIARWFKKLMVGITIRLVF